MTPTWTQLPEGAFHPLDRDRRAASSLGRADARDTWQLDERLAPFGQENPVPVFLARDVTLANCRAVGAETEPLLRARSPTGAPSVAGIMFHCADIERARAHRQRW
ncbi:MAG: hypothetical protein ACLTDR_15360 [Adlercreutzia equolifaciens]